MIFVSARIHPTLIVPLVGEIANDGGRLRWNLHEKSVRIGLLLPKSSLGSSYGIFVVGARCHGGQKDFPDAAGAPAHGMPPLIPLVEIAHHADNLRIRRPHGK